MQFSNHLLSYKFVTFLIEWRADSLLSLSNKYSGSFPKLKLTGFANLQHLNQIYSAKTKCNLPDLILQSEITD